MARRRLAVVVLAPDELAAARVDALRRAIGAREPFHVAPHCTLIPPTNVRDEDVAAVLGVLRTAAAGVEPFDLEIGPVRTFEPVTPTVHLDVAGDGVGSLRRLRSALRRGPFDRPDPHPDYEPHVTLRESCEPERIEPAVELLSGARDRWAVARIHLLEQRPRDQRRPELGTHWVPIREEPLGGPAVVGRGGIERVLRTVGMVEDEVAELCGVAPIGPLPGPSVAAPIVVAAEGSGAAEQVLGAAVGAMASGSTVAQLDVVAVAHSHRGEGMGRHLLAAWCSAVAARGARAVAAPGDDGFLAAHGFVEVGGLNVRVLG